MTAVVTHAACNSGHTDGEYVWKILYRFEPFYLLEVYLLG